MDGKKYLENLNVWLTKMNTVNCCNMIRVKIQLIMLFCLLIMIQIMPPIHVASNPKVKYLQNSEHINLSDTGY
jgi:hypothetical protein